MKNKRYADDMALLDDRVIYDRREVHSIRMESFEKGYKENKDKENETEEQRMLHNSHGESVQDNGTRRARKRDGVGDRI